MAAISLIRIDFRLIHGQVVTKWVKQANADRIIIVNDALANDEFLGSVSVSYTHLTLPTILLV